LIEAITVLKRDLKGWVFLAVRSQAETTRIRYLLGLCSPAERERVEAEYFNDADAFEKMVGAEDDLIDAYARGELTTEERRRFEERFVNSSRGRERVQFARAFTGAVVPPVVTKRVYGLARIAAVAAVVVVVVLSWLVIDRWRMNDELRELRAAHAKLSEETAELKLKTDVERARVAEVTAELQDLRAQADKPKPREVGPTRNQRVSRPKVKNDRETVASSPSQKLDQPPILTQEATLEFRVKKITQLPLEAKDVEGLLSLQPGITRDGYVAGDRENQSNITLDGVDIVAASFTIFLASHSESAGGEMTAHVAKLRPWFRFYLHLDTPARHTDYRVIIENAKGRRITSLDWIEPLTPNQITIDTPVINAADLPSGDYKLTLMGKEPKGSFKRVARYSFKLIRN